MATLTSNSLDNCTSIPDFIPAGTKMVFSSTQAPDSWTKLTTHDNKALRLVTGPPSPGGTTVFSTVFPASQRPVAGSITAVNSVVTFQDATISEGTGLVNAYPTLSIQARTIDTSYLATHNHSYQRRVPGVNTAGQSGGTQVLKRGLEAIQFGQTSSPAPLSHDHGWQSTAQHNHTVPAVAHNHTISNLGPHSHGFTTTAQDFAIKYVDVIVCSKD